MELVAGDGFGGFFGGGAVGVGVAVTVRMTVAIASGRSDCYGLACVGEIGWGGFGDI